MARLSTSHINCLPSWLWTSLPYFSSSFSLSASFSALSTSQILLKLQNGEWNTQKQKTENNFLKSQLINHITIRLWTMLLLAEFLFCFYCIASDTEKVHSFYFDVYVVTFPELDLTVWRLSTNFWRYSETEIDIMYISRGRKYMVGVLLIRTPNSFC